MKAQKFVYALVLTILLLGSPFSVFATTTEGSIDLDAQPSLTNTSSELDPQYIEDMAYPTAVRIIQHVSGSAQIPSFIIDSETGDIAIDPLKAPVEVENIREYIISSGFFVSSDGLILTTAHGVSDTMIKLALVHSFIEQSLKEALGEEDVSQEMAQLFSDKSIEFILGNTTFNITKDVIVVDPSLSPDQVDDTATVFDLGIPATIVESNDTFYKSGANVALIKIKGNNYPYIPFSDELLLVGDQAYVLDVDRQLVLEKISDIAEERFYDFTLRDIVIVRTESSSSSSMYLSNTQIVPQSAGSPVFGVTGEVVGLTVFDGLESITREGSMNMRILGRAQIEKALPRFSQLKAQEQLYNSNFRDALQAYEELKCEMANTAFDVAVAGDNPFMDRAQYTQYVNECMEEMQMLDPNKGGFADMIDDVFAGRSVLDWAVFSGVAMLIVVIIIMVYMLLRRLSPSSQKNSEEISKKTGERPEEIKNARRNSMVESLPLQPKGTHYETTSGGNDPDTKKDIAPAKFRGGDNKVPDEPSKKDQSKENTTPKEAEKSSKFSSMPEATSGEDTFYTVPARFPRRYEGDETHTGKPSDKQHRVPNEVPEKDKEKLAGMWPQKYGSQDGTQKTTPKEKTPEKKERVIPEVLHDAVDYIRSTRKQGFNDKDIKEALREAGWREADISNAFTFI